MTKLIENVCHFCHENNVGSLSAPPMGSGVLNFSTKKTAR